MPVLPFRWHGSTRLAQIEQAVDEHARAWLGDWAVAPDRFRCAVGAGTRACHAVPEAGESWIALCAGPRTVLLRGPDFLLDQLGADLADVPIPTRNLAKGIARRALVAFGRALLGQTVTLELVDRRPGADEVDARRGVAHFAWSLGTLELDLYLDVGVCDLLAPGAKPNPTSLVSRRDALLAESVVLHAVLDLGTAALADTLSLRPGEVIKTNTPLTAMVRLQSEAGAHLAAGALVASGVQRGIRIVRTT
jgi:hypothetical protein